MWLCLRLEKVGLLFISEQSDHYGIYALLVWNGTTPSRLPVFNSHPSIHPTTNWPHYSSSSWLINWFIKLPTNQIPRSSSPVLARVEPKFLPANLPQAARIWYWIFRQVASMRGGLGSRLEGAQTQQKYIYITILPTRSQRRSRKICQRRKN